MNTSSTENYRPERFTGGRAIERQNLANKPERNKSEACEKIVSGTFTAIEATADIVAVETAIAGAGAGVALAGGVALVGLGIASGLSGASTNADSFFSPGGLAGGVMGPAFGLSPEAGSTLGDAFDDLVSTLNGLSELKSAGFTAGEILITRYVCGVSLGQQLQNRLGPLQDLLQEKGVGDNESNTAPSSSSPSETKSSSSGDNNTGSTGRGEREHSDRFTHENDNSSNDCSGDSDSTCSPDADSSETDSSESSNDSDSDSGFDDDGDIGCGGDESSGDSETGDIGDGGITLP